MGRGEQWAVMIEEWAVWDSGLCRRVGGRVSYRRRRAGCDEERAVIKSGLSGIVGCGRVGCEEE